MKKFKVITNRGFVIVHAPVNLAVCVGISVGLFINYFFSDDKISLLCTGLAILTLMLTSMRTLNPTFIYFTFFSYLFRYDAYNLYGILVGIFMIRCVLTDRSVGGEACVFIPLYLVTHFLSADFEEINFASIVPFLSIFSLYFMCHLHDKSQEQNDLCIKYYLIAHVISSIMGFFKDESRIISILSDDMLSNIEYADTLRYSGLSFDCNFYAVLAIVALICLLLRKRKFKHSVYSVLLILGIIFVGLLTYSKSFIISAVMCILVALFNVSKGIRRRGVQMIAFGIIGILFFSSAFFDVIGVFVNRFKNNTSLDAFTTNRFTLWTIYVAAIFESPTAFLLGHGFTSYIRAAHNTYLEVLYKFGLVGFLSDILYLMLARRKMKKNKKHYRYITKTAIYIIFFALLFNLSAYTFPATWVCLFIIWIVTDEYSVEKEELCQELV